jgi:hypothetical protein
LLGIGLKDLVNARLFVLMQRMPSSFGEAMIGKLTEEGSSRVSASIGLIIIG